MKLFELSGPGAAALLDRACPMRCGGARDLAVEIHLLPQRRRRHHRRPDRHAACAGALHGGRQCRQRGDRRGASAEAGQGFRRHGSTPLDRVFLAIQGPEAWAAMSRAGIETGTLTFMHGIEPRPDWFMSRSGYTGEDGFEIGLPEADARDLVDEAARRRPRHVDRARRARQPAPRGRALPARPGHRPDDRPGERRPDVGDPEGASRRTDTSSAPRPCARSSRAARPKSASG